MAAGALAPAAAQAGNTNLTISWNGVNAFSGQSKSQKSKCVNGRKVSLYRKQPGKDKRIGKATTAPGKGDSEGVWIIGHEDPVGTYYAKVKRNKNKGCDADKSKEIPFSG
jgi:hypothetical protein